MPVTPTYPGVYVEEIPSGVRTIVGVATSITAFVGTARRGPVNRAERVLNFGDFSKKFGGLFEDSEMSYAVQQFFLNGGNEAWIVRIAKNATAAKKNIKSGTLDILEASAIYEGMSGNGIMIDIDYKTSNPDNTFNMTVTYKPEDNPSETRVEKFTNLTMNDQGARYTVAALNDQSELVRLKALEIAEDKDPRKDNAGTSVSGKLVNEKDELIDLAVLLTKPAYQFVVMVNGLLPATVKIKKPDDFEADDAVKRIQKLCETIQTKVNAVSTKDEYAKFKCEYNTGEKTIVMTSGVAGAHSSVQVTPGFTDDLTGLLKLGLAGGGKEKTADSLIRPNTEQVILSDGKEDSFSNIEAPGMYFPADGELKRTGVYALQAVDLFNILCLPGIQDPDILSKAAAYCEDRRAFLIADGAGGDDKNVVTPDRMEKLVMGTVLPKSKNAAVYYPWLKVSDTLSGKIKLRPPCGTLAGLYARTDNNRGVWKAPAGTEANLVNVRGLEYQMTDDENGILNPHGVNCLRIFPVYGIIAWGARTLRGDDEMADEWKYISVRRTALFIEETLYRNLKWVVFEPNDEPLWAQIRLNVGAFMHDLFRKGAFQGTTPRDAYFVKCDKETTTQTDINLGIVNILVGFAPLKPAEFVIIKLQQMAGQIEV